MNDDQKKHQAELAASGYRLPDSFYVAPAITDQPSTEQTSGDGGKANADLGPDDSDIGYKGELTPAADAAKATLQRSAAQARAARNDRETPAEVGLRVATEGHIAVGAAQKPGISSRGLESTSPTATGSDDSASSGSGANVTYASSAANDAATEAGLTAEDFVGVPMTGANGYTKSDVEAAIAKKGGK